MRAARRGLLALWLLQLLLPSASATQCTDDFVRLSADGRELEYKKATIFLNGINAQDGEWQPTKK